MDLLLILTYTAICVVIFKVFRIPLNKWSVPTAILGGIVLLGMILMLMNYNHPYGKYAKEYFVSVPIVPAVKGIVVSVEAEPNIRLKQGDVLFRIDPKPFELKVAKKRAQLVEAEQQFKQSKAQFEAAEARVKKAKADRNRSKQSYDRYAKGNKKGGAKIFSEQEVENRRQLYFAAQAGLEATEADLLRIRLAYESQIDGVNTRVAQLHAELDSAEYDLERSIVRAPADGTVTQFAVRPGVMVASLPLRPAAVFIPDQRRIMVGSFWQNSLLRMKRGYQAEVIIDAVPGHVFKGALKQVLPAMAEGDIQATGNLISARKLAEHGRALALIELEEDLDNYGLPRGVQGKMAIFSDHDVMHVSLIRRVLLRMVGWLNYAFPIK
ncbi:MAG: HlyD family secretion protein [Candidatus Thiodiazotropha sp. (ex Epidulcina cf. delphinae)]|nr:HlyD family secretion protein [Candidatus Thiodiazotropha sp. (ex Epidulcina cf. delphinae)]